MKPYQITIFIIQIIPGIVILSVSDFAIGNYSCVIKGFNDVLKSVKFTKSK